MSALDGIAESQQSGGKGTGEGFSSVLGGDDAKYKKIRKLGVGSFGEAWLVKRNEDGHELVAKILDLSTMSAKDEKYVEGEIQCLASCSHFAIVKYYEDFREENKMLLMMEFADAGDLNMQIKQRAADNFRYFDEHEIGYTFVQLAMALDHVHRRKMLHRDIKGANILLMRSGLIKLGDFGFSHQYDETVSGAVATTFCGTPYYLAPELWQREKYSKKADVWSLGILLYEMMALKRPFVGQGMRALMQSVMAGDIPALPERYSSGLREIVAAILVADPNKRPNTTQLFHMPQMQHLLKQFEYSVNTSSIISVEQKQQIADCIQEIRDSKLDDLNTGTSAGKVGTIRTDITYESPIRKESNRVWKERYLVLRNGELIISLRKGEKEAPPMSLSQVANVVPIPFHAAKTDGVFAINTTDQKSMWMQAGSRTACYEWIHKLQQAMGIA